MFVEIRFKKLLELTNLAKCSFEPGSAQAGVRGNTWSTVFAWSGTWSCKKRYKQMRVIFSKFPLSWNLGRYH